MITFRVLHHIPGRIRIEIPSLKGLPLERLRKLSSLPVPEAIKEVRPNPLTGSVVIAYAPDKIDILQYLRGLASNRKVQKAIGEET